jgi:hypothetical protein
MRLGSEWTWQRQMNESWDRVWMRLFHDAPIPRSKHRRLEHYAVSVLSGLAVTRMLEGTGAKSRPEELGWLKDTLVRELTGPA